MFEVLNIAVWMTFLATVFCQHNPKIHFTFQVAPKNSSLIVNRYARDVVFNCTVENREPNSKVYIRLKEFDKNTVKGPISSDAKVADPVRFTGQFLEPNTYLITLKNVKIYDEGIYECFVYLDTENTIQKQLKLEVREAPHIDSGKTTSSINIEAGRDATLTCIATGAPKPKISWKRKGDQNMPARATMNKITGELVIRDVQPEDRGGYICTAKNSAAETSFDAFLEVLYGPILTAPTTADSKGSVQADEEIIEVQAPGYKKSLVCLISSNPAVKEEGVSWTFNDNIIPSHHEVKFIERSENDRTSKLVINSVTQADYGKYTCSAANGLGTQDITINLKYTKSATAEQIGSVISAAPYSSVLLTLIIASAFVLLINL